MGEEEKLCVLATGPKASGKLWTDTESKSSQKLSEQSKILGLVLADGEKVEGVHFMQNKAFLLWTESGNIYRVDLGENKYHKIGRPGRIHMVCSDGCDGGFAAVLAGGRPRVLYIEIGTGKIRWRVVEEEEVKGVALDGNTMSVWGDTRVGLWKIDGCKSPRLLARLFASTSLAGVRLFKELQEQMAVTVTKDGKIVVWKVAEGSQPKLKSSLDLKVKVGALFLEMKKLFIVTDGIIVQVDLGDLAHHQLLSFPSLAKQMINNLSVFTQSEISPVQEQPFSRAVPQNRVLDRLAPQQMTGLASQGSDVQAVPYEAMQNTRLHRGVGTECLSAQKVQVIPGRAPQALVHLQTEILLLQQSNAPLHLVTGTYLLFI